MMGTWYNQAMRIIARSTLRTFWEKHTDTEGALKAWYQETNQGHWQTPEDVKSVYAAVSIVPGNRIVFNIKGNRYRLVTTVNYRFGIVYIRFIGSHQEYDKIDAATI
jgi:mRNA interferase HigB